MRKVINLEDLDCPVCAQKIEDKLKKMPEINEVSVSFITQKIILDVNEEVNFNSLIKNIKKAVKSVEPDCVVID